MCRFILYEKFINSINFGVLIIIIFSIFEIIYSLILTILKFDSHFILNALFGVGVFNFIVGATSYLFVKNKKINKQIVLILNILKRNQTKGLLTSIVILITILMHKDTYYSISTNCGVNLILISIFIFLLILYLNEKKGQEKLAAEQETLYRCVIKYEKQLDKKNKVIHDFKNQLLVINGFVLKENKPLKKYLNTLVSDLKNADNISIKELNKLPLGGLRGLLSCKLADIDELNIKLSIYVDEKVSKLEQLNINIYKNVVKILGIYLDNAIEASSESPKKEIGIEMFKDKDKLIFIISNSYKGELQESKLGLVGYSSKGKNRGYGLAYVKDIIKKETNLNQKSNIKAGMYFAILEVKI
jgi:two-component system sensor histidine kinase AgrC